MNLLQIGHQMSKIPLNTPQYKNAKSLKNAGF
jgi:hypothetical protein